LPIAGQPVPRELGWGRGQHLPNRTQVIGRVREAGHCAASGDRLPLLHSADMLLPRLALAPQFISERLPLILVNLTPLPTCLPVGRGKRIFFARCPPVKKRKSVPHVVHMRCDGRLSRRRRFRRRVSRNGIELPNQARIAGGKNECPVGCRPMENFLQQVFQRAAKDGRFRGHDISRFKRGVRECQKPDSKPIRRRRENRSRDRFETGFGF